MGNYRKYRQAPRKDLVKLTISSLSSQESLQKLAKAGQIIEASASGILIKIERSDFVSKELKANLNIDQLLGKSVYFKIHEMNLEIGGVVARTKFLGKDGFMIAIDYTVDAPEYWRECLMDLLPTG